MYSLRYLLQHLAEWRLVESEAGVTAIEYALIAAIMTIAIVGGATAIGVNLSSFFNSLASVFPT